MQSMLVMIGENRSLFLRALKLNALSIVPFAELAAPALAFQNDGGTRLCIRCFAQHDHAASCSICRLAKPEPCRKRNTPAMLRRFLSEIQHDGCKPSGLQQQVGCTQRLVQPRPWLRFSVSGFSHWIGRLLTRVIAATNPEHAPQRDTASRRRFRIEGISGIDPRTKAFPGLLCQKSHRNARPARRCRPGNFRDCPHRQSATQQRINLRDPGGRGFADRSRLWRQCRGIAMLKSILDLLAKSGRGRHSRRKAYSPFIRLRFV